MKVLQTRSLGRSAALLLALAEGLRALRAIQGAFGPLLSSSIKKYTLRQSFRYLEHQIPSSNIWDNFLLPFLAPREAVVPAANDPIMLGTLIRSFRHLEHQNPYSNSWDNWLVPFLATREAVAPLVNDPIMSERLIRLFGYLEPQNPSIISDSIDWARCGKVYSSNFGHQGSNGTTCQWSFSINQINMVF